MKKMKKEKNKILEKGNKKRKEESVKRGRLKKSNSCNSLSN